MILDIEKLLKPKLSGQPCGENPEDNTLYSEMENAKEGSSGHSIVGASTDKIPPDWKRVKKLSIQLFDSSIDLRVATSLSMACLHTDGFPGLREGIELLSLLIDRYWSCLHPALDSDDSEPAFMRANAFYELTSREFLLAIDKQVIIETRVHGKISLSDVRNVQQYKNSTDNELKQQYLYIEGVIQEVLSSDNNTLPDTVQCLEECHTQIATLGAAFNEKANTPQSVNFQPLIDLLTRNQKLLASKIPEQLAADNNHPSTPEPSTEQDRFPKQENSASSGNEEDMNIYNTDHVIEAIDKICTYYQQNEPSSPVPLLLKRARNMVNKNFFEILQDISPDSTPQAEKLLGTQEEDNK